MSATIATRPPRSHPTADPADRGRALLARLFAGDFPFPSVPVCPPPSGDRSAAEHDALSRAAGCRDLFVIHADILAGERVIADLVRASADRVLILTPDPVAADRLAERLLTSGVPVIRALADDDNPTRPSAAVSKVTSAALGVAQAEQTRRAAAAALAAAEKRISAFAVVSKAVARLVEVNESLKALDADVTERAARAARVEADVADEASGRAATSFTELLAARKTAHDIKLAELGERRTVARKAADEKEAEVTVLRQHAAAANKSGFFARLFSKPKPAAEVDEIKKSLPAAESELAALTATATALQTEFEALSASGRAEREKLIADELTVRRSAAESALQAAEAERARAQAEVAALNKAISAAVPNDDYTAAAGELTAARERAAEAARSGPETLARATAEVRAVIGTPRCLDADPIFAAFTADPPFGLLVLDRAEDLPEAEFPRLSRQAERWVLIGDTAPRDEPRSINSRAPRGRPADIPFACRVAKLLDRETWAPEGDRLVCRLVHLSPDQRRNLAREPLADRPEIELRFTTDDEPVLAEIAFPGSTAVPAAKSFLFHALGEIRLRPCGEVVWAHAPDLITATWPVADAPRSEWVDLEPGVREKVTGVGLFAYTAAVSFDPAAGWDAERAAEWLGTHLPPPPIGRFAAVPRSR